MILWLNTESVLEHHSWFLLALQVIDEISNNACSSSLQRQSGSSGGWSALCSYFGLTNFVLLFRNWKQRSIIPPRINILALTATLTSEILVSITERVALKSLTILATSPQRNNTIVLPITVDLVKREPSFLKLYCFVGAILIALLYTSH